MGIEAGLDASLDVGTDAGVDAAADAGVDARADLGVDTGIDASVDAGVDARADTGLDVGTDAGGDSGADGGGGVVSNPGPPVRASVVAAGSTWRYLDNGSDQGTAWRATAFSDGSWRSGRAQLGYGDGDEATVVGFGPDANSRYVTTWFRQRFDVANAAGVRQLRLRLVRDDGAVVYLNGREVFRSNMPSGNVTYTTLASTSVGSPEENQFVEASLDPGALVEGANSVAVEVHQNARSSSDVSFDLELITTRDGAPVPGGDPVLLAAGDIARCDTDNDELTARVLDGQAGTVALMGDNVYEDGTEQEFRDCYHPTWGRHLYRTRPSVGNHEYHVAGAAPYYRYFGAAAGSPREGWYSYELGAWHVVVLNSNCGEIGGCQAGSPQERWLRADLAAHPARCTLAYMHHPRFASGGNGSASMGPFFQALYDHGVELLLVGHDHTYERFAPQRPDGTADAARGVREFVLGTGGTPFGSFGTTQRNSEVRQNNTWGVLRVVLRPTRYDFEFLPVQGRTFTDRGGDDCH